MVIGAHPHVVQPIVKKEINEEEKLTVWSLGNFVSNMQTRTTRGGVMVGATVHQTDEGPELGEVNSHLIYVMRRNEGATTPYYVLPDFPYNDFRVTFVSSLEADRMRTFLSDSRKLYGQHNSGVEESIVDLNSDVGKRIKQLLTSYVSVEVTNGGSKWINSEILGHYFHKHVDKDGGVHYLSGYYYDTNLAKGQMNFLKDCGVESVKLVEVKPTIVENL